MRAGLTVRLDRVARSRRALPANVRALGWVSFANDLASELLYPILPLFLTVTLGAPASVLGLVEGLAEGAAVGLRAASGRLSDLAGGRRRPWILAGYGATTLSRPLLAAAPAWGWVLAARLVDRTGKAARTAPRDALIRDSTEPARIGAAFGYHRALDTAGAVLGPLVAVGLLTAGLSLRAVLWIAVVPGVLALLLVARIREAPASRVPTVASGAGFRSLPRRFWLVLAVWTVFSIGNSSDVFLLLRANDLGLGVTLSVLAYAAYNLVYSGLAWPLGALSDRVSRTAVLGGGLALFAGVYAAFGFVSASWAVWPLFLIYGVYIAATDGVARAWVADHAPRGATGTAYGAFAAATGAALLVASVLAGQLWSRVSPRAPFLLGAGCAATALVLLVLVTAAPGGGTARRPRPARRGDRRHDPGGATGLAPSDRC